MRIILQQQNCDFPSWCALLGHLWLRLTCQIIIVIVVISCNWTERTLSPVWFHQPNVHLWNTFLKRTIINNNNENINNFRASLSRKEKMVNHILNYVGKTIQFYSNKYRNISSTKTWRRYCGRFAVKSQKENTSQFLMTKYPKSSMQPGSHPNTQYDRNVTSDGPHKITISLPLSSIGIGIFTHEEVIQESPDTTHHRRYPTFGTVLHCLSFSSQSRLSKYTDFWWRWNVDVLKHIRHPPLLSLYACLYLGKKEGKTKLEARSGCRESTDASDDYSKIASNFAQKKC